MPEPASAATAVAGPPAGPFAALPPRALTAADPRSLLHARFGLQPLVATSIAALSPAQAEQGSAAVAVAAAVGRSANGGGGGTAAPSVLSAPSQWGHSRSASGTVTPSVQSASRSTMAQAGQASRAAQRSVSPPAGAGSGSGPQAPPLCPASPLAFQRALGLEKRTEAGLVALLMGLATAAPPTNTKVSEPRSGALLAAADAAASLATPPPTPPAANDPQWQRSAACARMAAGAGRDPNALLHAEERMNAAAVAATGDGDGGAPLVRLTRTMLAALPPALRRDPRWQSPFVSPPGHAHAHAHAHPGSPSHSASQTQSGSEAHAHAAVDSPALAALRALWESEEAEEGPRGLAGAASLAQLDPGSGTGSAARLRVQAFRAGVRAALLTARSEKQFHRQVEMLAAATGAVAPRITAGSPAAAQAPAVDPARLYPFLKLWGRLTALERRTGLKRALKAQLDALQSHPYYSSRAFGDQHDPRHRAAYAAWIKAQALRLHAQMLALSDEIADLKAAQSLAKNLRPVTNLFRRCFGLCTCGDDSEQQLQLGDDGGGDEGPESMTLAVSRSARSSSGDEDLWSHAPSRMEDPRGTGTGSGTGAGLVEPPRPDDPPQRFGQRSARAALKKQQRVEARAQRRLERGRRNEARRARRVAARHSTAPSPPAISASEADSPSGASSSDTEWERSEAQAREREVYRARQAALLQARRAWDHAVRRANDTRGLLRDMGIDEDDEGLNGNQKKKKQKKKKTPAAALSPREAGYGPRSPVGSGPKRGAGAAAAAASPTAVAASGSGSGSANGSSSYGSVDSAAAAGSSGGGGGGGASDGDQSHALYAVLLWSLLRLEPDCDSAATAAGAVGGPQPPSRRSSQAGATLMVPSLSQVGFLGAGGASAAAVRPFQAVHTRSPALNESFNPALSASARGFLDAFAGALGVGPVFCSLQMLHVLVSNLQRTESYWTVARQVLQSLDALAGGPGSSPAAGGEGGGGGGYSCSGWTRLEVMQHVVYVERMLQWAAQCATNYAAVFALQIDAHKRKNGDAAATGAPRDADGEDAATTTTTDDAHQSASPASERKRGSVLKKGHHGKGGAAPPAVHPAANMGEAALVACLHVVRLCWQSMMAHASAHVDAAVPATAGAALVASSAAAAAGGAVAATNPLHSSRFTLEHYLAPHMADGLHRLYEDLSWQAGRAAAAAVAASVAGGGARIDDPPEDENEPAVRAPGPHVHRHTPLAGDAHLTLLLHALVAEVAAVDSTGRDKFASGASGQAYGQGQEGGQNLSAEWLGSLARRVLVKRFWNDAQRFIAADRIPKLLFARAQLGASAFGSGGTGMTTGASTPGGGGGFGLAGGSGGVDYSASRKLGREIHVVFDLYASLAWFQYAVQAPRYRLDVLAAEPVPDLRVQRRTQREWIGLRRWFAAIVDGFVDTLVEEIAQDVAEIFGSLPPSAAPAAAAASSPANGQVQSPRLSTVRPPLNSLKDVMAAMDTRLTQLLRKPATRAHKRVLVDALARLATAYCEARLLQSSAPPPPSPDQAVPSPAAAAAVTGAAGANGATITPAARRAGLVEELHIRHYLNRLYQARYPPGATGAADKDGRSAAPAPSEREPKPEHKFGYDPVLPRVCAASVRQLNEMRVANVKLVQLLLVGGGGGSGADAPDAALALEDDPAGAAVIGSDASASALLSPSSSSSSSSAAAAPTPLRRGFFSTQLRALLVQSLSFLAESLCAIIVPATVSNLLRMAAPSAGGGPNPNRWPASRVEKCLGESLGFLYEHIESLKAHRLHQDLLRELGLFVLLEYADAFAGEMRNVARVVSADGVVYFRPREVERVLVKDQLLRIADAIKVVKAFVTDVCEVPEHWFESTFPRGLDAAAAAATVGGGAQANANANAFAYGRAGASSRTHQAQPQPPLAQLLGVGPYAPKSLVADPKAAAAVFPPAFARYVLPPAWGAATTVLTELWKIERLLAVMLAPSLTLATLYASHVEPGMGAAATEGAWALGLVLGAGAAGDESDDEAGGDDDSAQASTPSRRGSHLQAGGHHFLSPPSRHSPALSTSASTVAPDGATVPASSAGLLQFPASSLASATEPAQAQAQLPHPFLLLGLSRWDIYRVMQSRARFVDDSAASEWLGKTSKPPKNRDAAEPPPTSILGKIGSWFGGSSPSPPPPQVPKEKPKKPRSVKLFGGPLGEAIKDNASSGSGVPRVVDECVRFLRSCALDEPGLFRIAGNKDAVDALRMRYDDAFQADDPARLPRLSEIHDAAGVLKLYYRSVSPAADGDGAGSGSDGEGVAHRGACASAITTASGREWLQLQVVA